MMKSKKYLFIAMCVALVSVIVSCGTVAGFEESKKSATEAKAKADETGVSKDDSIYQAATSDFNDAETKEKAKDQKGAMSSYTKAEGQFKTAVKKKETNDAIKAVDRKITDIDSEIDKIE